MKKLRIIAVGLLFVFGGTAAFAQEKGGDTHKTKKTDKKKSEKKQPGDDRPAKKSAK